ncbi:FlgD immunoglobulin-like domain containing protein [Streptomyces sp. NBC_01268]|uniref:FlgD immunoglobulin-like domain containing protein n=1 Tax=Streptomyces sp. NBC_01268 TaxID=2903806 RepID=UPI002E37F516|nr:FlgD immunoglobulin-like domain containing protein [Streptomyces sp. NBC_01268]
MTAAVASLAPLAGGTAVAAEAPAAQAPLTIPAERHPGQGLLRFAGTTGFMHEDSGGYAWVPYAGGKPTRFAADRTYTMHGGDGDVIARQYDDRVVLQDGPTGPGRTVTIPQRQRFAGVQGGKVLTNGEDKAVHVLSVENGVQKDVKAVAPAGSAWSSPLPRMGDWQGNGRGFFVAYSLNGKTLVGWVALDDPNAAVRPTSIPYVDSVSPPGVSGMRAYTYDWQAHRLSLWDLAGDLTKPVADIALPEPPTALVGQDVLVRTKNVQSGNDVYALYPLSGGEPRPAFDAADVVPTQDGGVLATITGADDQSVVHKAAIPADGSAPVLTRLYATPGMIAQTRRIAVAQGELNASENFGLDANGFDDMYGRVTSRRLTVSGELAVGPKTNLGFDPEALIPGHCLPACVPVVPTGDGRIVLQKYPGGLYAIGEGQDMDHASWTGAEPFEYGRDFQVSGRYVSFVAEAQTGPSRMREVRDIDTTNAVFSHDLGDRRTALDGDTLWAESTTTGIVDAVDLRTSTTKRTVKLAGCDLTGLQVVGSFAYWKCATSSGVKNLDTLANISLPAHTNALLGDGYLAHEKGGTVSVTPLRGGGATRAIGTVADSRPDYGWTVDRFGGHVSLVDADQNIHVVPTGVPASPLRLLDEERGKVDRKAKDPTWTAKWWLNKPAASWKVDVRDSAGTVVRTLSGGEARGVVKPAWDGKDAAGNALPDGLYDWTLTAAPADGVGPALTRTGDTVLVRGQSTLATGRYQPVPPTRVMDTRDGTGVAKAKLGADRTVTLTVAGRGGVPAKGVSAVVLNVTATNATASTFVSAYPSGTVRTSASNLNVVAGRTVPNLVVVPVKDGKVTFYNRSGSVDLLADVAGYYTLSGQGSLYEPVTPTRLMDTRDGTGVAKAKVGAGKTVTLTVAGKGGVPAEGVTAVVLNVTATNPTASTFVSVYPYGTTRTSASNLNVVAGQTVPNLVVVPVKDGKVTFYNRNGSLDLLADVAGYYTSGTTGSLYEPVTPARLMDTRDGFGGPPPKVGADKTVTLTVAGRGGVPAEGVTAVVLNVTATNPTSSTFVSVYPYGTTRTSASNLNVVAGQTVPNLVVVPVKDGKVTFYNRSGSIDLIADVAGFYGP